MKIWKLIVLFGFFSPIAFADDKFGVGFKLGEPSSLSGKYIVDAKVAYDAQISFTTRDYLVIYGDRLFHFPDLITQNSMSERLSPYVGVGPLFVFQMRKDHDKGQYFNERDDKLAFGVRVPFGIEWMWEKVPLGIGLELAPGIMVLPATIGILQGGLSLRYYFN